MYLRFLSLNVFNPNLDHPESLGLETCKIHMWVSNQKYFIYVLFWSCTYELFNPNLDHPAANVINCTCIYKRVHLNRRGRKHVKYICEYQIRSTSFMFFFETVLTISFLSLNVFNPKLDHPDANVINCIYKRVHLNPWGRKHVKHSCEHQIKSTLFYSSLKLYLRFRFLFMYLIQNWIILMPM